MRTATYNSAKELKCLKNIKSINGVTKLTCLEITNKYVSIYSADKQENVYLNAPFNIEFE